MKFLKELFLINLNYFLAIKKIAAISICTMKLAEPVLSRSTAKNRILDITAPFTNGVFKDTREQAEKLYGALLVNGAKVELVKEKTSEGHSESGFVLIRQFVNVTACGHVFKLVCVHCLCDVGTSREYGDLCFYTV